MINLLGQLVQSLHRMAGCLYFLKGPILCNYTNYQHPNHESLAISFISWLSTFSLKGSSAQEIKQWLLNCTAAIKNMGVLWVIHGSPFLPALLGAAILNHITWLPNSRWQHQREVRNGVAMAGLCVHSKFANSWYKGFQGGILVPN